jgi:hypothetical protein
MVAKALQAPQYTGKIPREIDRVWLAAMLDAEGTICGFTHERKDNGDIRNGIHVHITNSNINLLNRCFEIWPTTREDHNPHSAGHLGQLPTWRWIVHSIEQKPELLAELYPYLVGKQKQALLAWNFLEISRTTRGRNKGEDGQSNREKYAWIVDAISKLNHLESVDIPTWCKEPPSLQADGWWLRQDIIWAKPNPMPESVTDRCTKAHEYIFMLTKSARYYYDAEAVAEDALNTPGGRLNGNTKHATDWPASSAAEGRGMDRGGLRETRNRRSVWTITTKPYAEAHFATFPPEIPETCIKASTKPDDIVLDPFMGSGTTGEVALRLGRQAIGFELNPKYAGELATPRLEAAAKGITLQEYREGQETLFGGGA